MTKSKIKIISKVNEWKGHGKRFFVCEMENGDKLSIMRGSVDALKIGDEIEYEKGEADEYGNCRIKEPQTNKKQFLPKNYKADAVSFALSYAKDLHQADPKVDLEKMADKMYLWMLQKYNALGL